MKAVGVLVCIGVLTVLGLLAAPLLTDRDAAQQDTPELEKTTALRHRAEYPVPTGTGKAAHRDTSAPGASAKPPPSAWQRVLPEAYPDGLPTLRDDVTEAELVTFERHALLELEAGDAFDLLLPQVGETFNVVVQQATVSAAGSRSIRGHINGNRLFSVVITLGVSGVFGSVNSPAGAFTVSGSGDLAWIVSNAQLRQHVDTSQADYRLPPPRALETLEPLPQPNR